MEKVKEVKSFADIFDVIISGHIAGKAVDSYGFYLGLSTEGILMSCKSIDLIKSNLILMTIKTMEYYKISPV